MKARATFLLLLLLAGILPAVPAAPPPAELVVVGFRSGIPSDTNLTLAQYGATLVRVDEHLDYILVAAPNPTSFMTDMRARADVEFAHPNRAGSLAVDRSFCILSGTGSQACTTSCSTPLIPPGSPQDPWYWGSCGQTPTNWGQQMVNIAPAWSRTTGSRTVIVAVVDTGIDPTHPDLSEAIVQAGGIFGINEFAAHGDLSPPADSHGHGTFIAGIIASKLNNGGMAGLAQTSILAVKACDPLCYDDTVASGIADATVAGASVITLSLSTPPPPYDDLMQRAVRFAEARGVLLLGAAGNCGCEVTPGASHDVLYPAKYAEVMAVGAVLPNRTVAGYSRWGPEIDLVGPGGGVNEKRLVSTLPGGTYGMGSGTSFSVAFVAGTAALLKAQHPEWLGSDLRARLIATASPLGTVPNDHAGYGVVDADAATRNP